MELEEFEVRNIVRLTIQELYPTMYIEDLASFFNISIDHVQKLLKKRRLPPFKKIGRRRVWLRSEINEFMEEGFEYDD
jgi:predicted DNA-binding transcriptional regulator AlpA